MSSAPTSSENAVVVALDVVVRDHGWLAAGSPQRLRAALSDLLGAQAESHRGAVDALVVSAEEGVPAEVRQAGRTAAPALRPGLVQRLLDWGMSSERAEWVVDVWLSLVPETTSRPVTDAPPTEPPAPVVPALPTELPPEPPTTPPVAQPDLTAVPVLPAIEPTVLPPPAGEVTSLPPEPATSAHEGGPEGQPEADEAAPASRRRWPVLAGGALLLLAGVGGAIALAGGGSGDGSPSASSTGSPSATADSSPAGTAVPTGGVVTAKGVDVAAAAGDPAMAGRVGGVTVTELGVVDRIGEGGSAHVAADGDELVAFTLADGPCQAKQCRSWKSLALEVTAGGSTNPLPAGGPTFAVAVPKGSQAALVFTADGVRQRLRLPSGDAAGNNVQVLLRDDRHTTVDASKTTQPFATDVSQGTVAVDPRVAQVTDADLFFFDGKTPLPRGGKWAYLQVGVTYTHPGSSTKFFFYPQEVSFEAAGTTYVPKERQPSGAWTFVVPAGLKQGRLVVGGTRPNAQAGPATYTLHIPDTPFLVKF